MSISGWKEPTDRLIEDALSRIGDIQHRRIFFERLENPLWVHALSRRHVFALPPEMAADSRGQQFWQLWPEGEYLVRMAQTVPEEVTTAVLAAASSSNPVVRELVLRAALALPSDLAARLVPSIERYLGENSLFDGTEVVALMEHLASGGQARPTLRLAKAAFLPRRIGHDSDTQGGPRSRNVTAGVEPYWFGELMPRVIAVLTSVQAEKALTTLIAWLNAFLEASGQLVDEASGYDVSYIWRPSIAPHEQNQGYEDYGDQLVDAVRDVCDAQLQSGRCVADVLTTLERGKQPLLRRIALHALARRVGADPEAARQASHRLGNAELLESEYRREYSQLATAALPHLSVEERNAWCALVLDGPPKSAEDLQKQAEYRRMDGESIEDAILRVGEYWQLGVLSGIDRAALPTAAAQRLANLEAAHGVLENPTFASFSTSWVGPMSPLSAEELEDLSPDDLIAFLCTWVPDSRERWSASKEGLARSFESRVKAQPTGFAARPERFDGLDPVYMSALFRGLREALLEGRGFDWQTALEIGTIVALRTDVPSETQGNREEEETWRFAQRALASLIEAGVGREGIERLGPEHFETAVSMLAPLINHPDPTPAHEERYGGSNMDPLTLSLNTTRPATLRSVIHIGSKARDQIEADAQGSMRRVISAVRDLCTSRLTPNRDESLAEAAAFGEGLGRLIWMDPEWVTANEGLLLSRDRFGDVVLSVALSTYRPTTGFMNAIRPAGRRLLTRAAAGEEIAFGWRQDRTPVEVLGDHLVLLLVWGRIEPSDELVTEFFALALPNSIGRVLGHLGWLLGRSQDPIPEDILRRARALWDERAALVSAGEGDQAELGEFFWWVRSRRFDPDWWLPRLEQAAQSPEFNARGMIGEQLAEAASRFPSATVRVLGRLLSQRDEPFGRYDLVEHAPAIIAAALQSGDDETVEIGKRVMNDLGRSGHLRIKELVQQHQVGG